MYEYEAELIRVVDGDTFYLRVDLGCNIRMDMTVRLAGVNTPEMSTPEGTSAAFFTTKWFAERGNAVRIKTVKDRKEKYGRYLAYIYWGDESVHCLNDDLVSQGYAAPYDGRKKGEK